MAEKIPLEEKKVNVGAEDEKNLGVEIGEAFPISEILAAARKNEKEEDKLIDKNIEARRIAEATHPNAINEALANAKPLKERKKNGNGVVVSAPVDMEKPIIPPELSSVFREVPQKVLEKYATKKTKKEKEKYIENLKTAQNKQAERENREIDEKKKKEEEKKIAGKHRGKRKKNKRFSSAPPAQSQEASASEEMKTDQKDIPNVFRKNRKRLIPTPTDVVQQELVATSTETVGQASGNSRRAMYSQLEDVSSDRAEAIMAGGGLTVTSEPVSPRDERNKLNGLIEKLTKMTSIAKEKFDWYKSSKEGLIRCNGELDAAGEKIGGLDGERLFRKVGEWYNKRDWKTKLAIGATLGLGATISVGVSVPLAYACLSGVAAQRLAGFATMYMKYEKKSHDEAWGRNKEWGKQKAMLKAGLYTVLMGLTMKEAIEYASGTELAHSAQAKVEGFLGWMMGHTASPPIANAPEAPATVATPQALPIQEDPAVAPSVAPTAEPSTPPVPEPAPRLPEPVPQPAAAAAASEQVSRPIAQGIQRPEAPSRFEMPKHADFSIHEDDTTISPYDVTPTDQSGAEDILSPEAEEVEEQVETSSASAPETPPVEELQVEKVSEPVVYPRVEADVLQTAENIEATSVEAHVPEAVTKPEPVPTPAEMPAEPSQSVDAVPETQSPAPVIEKSIVSNQFGLAIPVAESHIYADEGAKHLLVYGGSAQERGKSMLEYLIKNPSKIIFGADADGKYRLPWHLVDGKVVPAGLPPRTGGLFGFLSSWMKAPEPEDLRQIIK